MEQFLVTQKRLTNKTILKLLDKSEGRIGSILRRKSILFNGLSDEIKAALSETPRGQNPTVMAQSERLRQYIQACEEEFGHFAFRAALQLVLGEGVPQKLLRRFYEDEEVSLILVPETRRA